MKQTVIAIFACAAAAGATQSASAQRAYVLSPTGTSFSASGTANISYSGVSTSCDLQLTGTTKPAQITGATFSGASGCSDITPAKLPWSYRPTSLRVAEFHHLTLLSPLFGQCGNNEVRSKISGGTITVHDLLPSRKGSQVCHVMTSLTTSPAISIVTQ